MNPPEPCPDNTPGTQCWCEQHPNSNHPGCRAMPIDSSAISILIVIIIITLSFKKLK